MALRQHDETAFDDVDISRDRRLVEYCQAGNQKAFDELYARYHERLYRFCFRRVRDVHDAEDITQEAFARAWKALPCFGGDRRFYPWLSVIAANLCTDTMRKRGRTVPTSSLDQSGNGFTGSSASAESSEDVVMAAEDAAMAGQAFHRLNDRHQKILSLREGSGWSYQKIAEYEGVEITAIETLLWRARQALKREYESLSNGTRAAFGLIGFAIAGVLRAAKRARLRHLLVHHARLRNLLVYHPRLRASSRQWLVAPGTGTALRGAAAAGIAAASVAGVVMLAPQSNRSATYQLGQTQPSRHTAALRTNAIPTEPTAARSTSFLRVPQPQVEGENQSAGTAGHPVPQASTTKVPLRVRSVISQHSPEVQDQFTPPGGNYYISHALASVLGSVSPSATVPNRPPSTIGGTVESTVVPGITSTVTGQPSPSPASIKTSG
ncbi:MAG: RNA polymerase sigma factor [Actinobacteria bacterium]|nr:RNA polymerase sigma factor [Actinomycetota bacterium]